MPRKSNSPNKGYWNPEKLVLEFELVDHNNGYAKAYVRIRELYPSEGNDDAYFSMTHHSYLDNFRVTGQIDTAYYKYDGREAYKHVYAVKPLIEEITPRSYEPASYLMRKVSKFLEKAYSKHIDKVSFGQYVIYVAQALGIKNIIMCRNLSPVDRMEIQQQTGIKVHDNSRKNYHMYDLNFGAKMINSEISDRFSHITEPIDTMY